MKVTAKVRRCAPLLLLGACGSQADSDLTTSSENRIATESQPQKSEATSSFDERLALTCESSSPDAYPVDIAIGEEMLGGQNLSCIKTVEAEGQTCAPNGGVSFLYPTGTGGIRATFSNPMHASREFGPFVKFSMTQRVIEFSGGFSSGDTEGSGAFADDWVFSVDRQTGTAKLTTEDNVEIYSCSILKRKF